MPYIQPFRMPRLHSKTKDIHTVEHILRTSFQHIFLNFFFPEFNLFLMAVPFAKWLCPLKDEILGSAVPL